jgi:hypothetical protein
MALARKRKACSAEAAGILSCVVTAKVVFVPCLHGVGTKHSTYPTVPISAF